MLVNISHTLPMKLSNKEMYVRFYDISAYFKHYNLKGLLIGNGWTDPVSQYPAYVSYAYEAGLIKQGSDQAKAVEDELANCKKIIEDHGSRVNIEQCENVLQTLFRVTRDEYSLFS